MALEKRYLPEHAEPAFQIAWQAGGIDQFDRQSAAPIYSIDTPPPTVSGHLHLGHVYSYSHADFMARFFRMNGYNVFYPMGFDDNGLPTERLVEKRHKVTAAQIGRQAFIERCLQVSEEAEQDYRALWQRLGLSIDWRYTYRSIDDHSRRVSQYSFLDLYRKGLVYRRSAPAIWCPECRTAIAQAELNDLERESEFVTLPFQLENEQLLPVATTRPELLAACVAVFVNPQDARYTAWIGQQVRVPLYGQCVPLLPDPAADPDKGTGAVMCCTFGDQTDVSWWHTHRLALIEAVGRDGRMLAVSGPLAGLPIPAARARVKELLAEAGLILARQPTAQSIRVHERCDTPVELLVMPQWFIRVLDHKETFLRLGEQLRWHPDHMHARYKAWVENLSWDWCISRQRYFGVPFPLWYCQDCGQVLLAGDEQLPVDPQSQQPGSPCPACGSTRFMPETDVMDTWATSSVSPEIVAGWLDDPQRFEQLFPLSMRPQAHEIIRTWAFYSIVKAYYHFGKLPWRDVFISGWGLAGEGMGKISKSRGGGPMPPMQMIERYSADAVRYWASSTSPGKDSIISEEKIQMGAKLVTKLWNVARFAEPFISGGLPRPVAAAFTPADIWILSSCQALVERATGEFAKYDYASAKSEIEGFFWRDLCDNYLEMAKLRLYEAGHPGHLGACWALRQVLLAVIKLLAPLLPYVTDAIYQALFAEQDGSPSVHRACWPKQSDLDLCWDAQEPQPDWAAAKLMAIGETLIAAATSVRRYKSASALSLGSELACLHLASADPLVRSLLHAAIPDLLSVTRARQVLVAEALAAGSVLIEVEGQAFQAGIEA